MNTFRTTILLALLTALVVWVGDMLGGRQGAIIALVLAGGMNFFSYWFSDKIVIKMYGGQEVSAQDDPELYGLVQDLAQRAGLPMPKVYMLPQDTPNAFATGRNPEHAAVAVTDGIRRILNKRELAGVLGHELSHVKHRDILVSTIAATLAGAISYLAYMAQWAAIFGGGRDREGNGNIFGLLIMIIVAPLAAMLIQMAVSRSRECDGQCHGSYVHCQSAHGPRLGLAVQHPPAHGRAGRPPGGDGESHGSSKLLILSAPSQSEKSLSLPTTPRGRSDFSA
jgi:heat shock protein HtpX